MDSPMTEYDVRCLEKVVTEVVPLTVHEAMRGVIARARALLAQRDRLVKERDDAVLKVHHAVTAEMKANEELTECRHALGGLMGPTYGISEEVKKVVAEREGQRKNMREVKVLLFPGSEGSPVPHPVIVARVQHLLAVEAAEKESDHAVARLSRDLSEERTERQKAYQKLDEVSCERDTMAARVKELEGKVPCVPGTCPLNTATSSTAVNPAKPGLQPMKCPCGGKIEFGRERVGHCLNCGGSCRVLDPPAPSQPPDGHMVHIPAEYCGKSSLMHAYADGYLAGKGAK